MSRRTTQRGIVLLSLGALALYLLRPGRSAATAVQDVTAATGGTIRLTEAQAAMKELIERRFWDAGLGWASPAAVANAWRESRLDPNAVGDGGHSVGLFQLNDCADCAGRGMTVAARKDADTNIARMIETAKASAPFLATKGQTHEQVTVAFAHYLENCQLCAPGEADSIATVRYLAAIYGPHVPPMVAA